MFGVVSLICAKKSFINQADAKGEWGWGGGGGGRRTGLRKVKAQITIVRGSPNRVTLMKFKGLLRYQKPHVTDNISIYAFAYNVQYEDSLYCCLYSNIRYNIQCRITNFLHCVQEIKNEEGSVVSDPLIQCLDSVLFTSHSEYNKIPLSMPIVVILYGATLRMLGLNCKYENDASG